MQGKTTRHVIRRGTYTRVHGHIIYGISDSQSLAGYEKKKKEKKVRRERYVGGTVWQKSRRTRRQDEKGIRCEK